LGVSAEMIALTLPYPPSTNHYWRHNKGRTHISEAGQAYRLAVVKATAQRGYTALTGRLAVVVDAFPPDHKRRDLDNAYKALLDSLTHAGLWLDDEQIDDLRIIRRRPEAPGAVVVRITEVEP
jgi:crossover junction endodeoxyribonuclease RusA